MFDLIEFDALMFIIPFVAFIFGYCFTGNFQRSKIPSEDESLIQGGEIFTMNKQIIQNLGFFTN